MEVTAENFQEQFGVLKAALENASFVAIDCEFTGLELERSTHAYDTPEERYRKLRESSLDFLVVQVGVCVFQHDKEKRGYTYKAFNFYVCPKQTVKGAPDRMFRCQASSLQFLSQHGFDFNKLFSHGVSYLRTEEAAQLSQALSERQTQQLKEVGSPNNGPSKISKVEVPKDTQQFIDDVLESVQKFLDSASGTEVDMEEEDGVGNATSKQDSPEDLSMREASPKKDGSALHLSECNGFKRKLIYQEVNARFGDKVQLNTESDADGMLHIAVRITGTPEEQRARLELRHKKEREDLELAHGFGRVLELLASSGKLIVGHNMLLDIMHLLSQFVDDLPKDYNEFKSMVRAAFPCLVDTKVLASDNAIKDSFVTTALELLLKQLRNRPSCVPPVETENGYGYSLNQAKYHEAGYDAFVTGMCLLGLCQQLGKYKDHSVELKETSPVLKPYLNRVHMMQSPDIPTLNMAGNEVIPSRSHILHATFPAEWRANDLYQLFNSFGQITIHWINSTQAFVAMASSPLATQALKKLGSSKTSTQESYRLQSYTTYMTRQSRQSATAVTGNKTTAPRDSDTTVEDSGVARKRKRSASLTSLTSSSPPRMSKEESGESKPKLVKKTTTTAVQIAVTEKFFEENDDWS
ncbi:poly(A)-specific ribonuclease PARN isoform X1 [Rhipicephalus sanguineus]|uniref:poly(A)-specific ribonuclease PARN isoform X1 n=2 Tax=Rhipicephalus sanguineus TaxID=34632 RepID=UPI001892E0E7|nr:poly(A)-specific ribonuclease PARN isoform X1 [Rhipicephalus sanguineus]